VSGCISSTYISPTLKLPHLLQRRRFHDVVESIECVEINHRAVKWQDSLEEQPDNVISLAKVSGLRRLKEMARLSLLSSRSQIFRGSFLTVARTYTRIICALQSTVKVKVRPILCTLLPVYISHGAIDEDRNRSGASSLSCAMVHGRDSRYGRAEVTEAPFLSS
jgi:hypothetical protein